MATLDDDYGYIDPSTVSPWQTAIRYGLIGGLISVIWALIGNLTGITLPTNGFMMMMLSALVGLIIYVGIIVYAVRHHRDNELGGYISLGRIVQMGIVISIISGLIGVIFNYVYVTFIDPNFIETMMEGMEEMFANLGMDEDQIEEALAGTEAGFEPLTMIKNGLLYSGILGAVVSLIIGFIMRRTRE